MCVNKAACFGVFFVFPWLLCKFRIPSPSFFVKLKQFFFLLQVFLSAVSAKHKRRLKQLLCFPIILSGPFVLHFFSGLGLFVFFLSNLHSLPLCKFTEGHQVLSHQMLVI